MAVPVRPAGSNQGLTMGKPLIGRPSKCTPDVIAKVCDALRLGVSWEAAGAHAGVDRATLTNWRKRGEAGEEPFATFLVESTRARDNAEVRMAAIVMKHAQEGNVLAAQWWLERRRPESWGRREKIEVESASPDHEVAAALRKLRGE